MSFSESHLIPALTSEGFPALPPPGSRWERMEARVAHAAGNAGIAPHKIALVLSAHRVAMARREWGPDALSSEQHPAYLHPGRTVLILIGDLEEKDPSILAAGAMAESRHLQLRCSVDAAKTALKGDDRALKIWNALPSCEWYGASNPDADAALLENLVVASDEVQRVAMAEALDHLRHAHLWESAVEKKRAVTLARDVFEPLSSRVHPTLERRLRWWLRRVGPGVSIDRFDPGPPGYPSQGSAPR